MASIFSNINEIQDVIMTTFEDLLYHNKFDLFLRQPSMKNFQKFIHGCNVNRDDVYGCYGQTKGVLVFKDLNVVVKMPFIRDDFGGFMFDYCQVEARNYKVAVAEHYGSYFAPCEKLFDYMGVPVYIQQKCICDESEVLSAISKTINEDTFGDEDDVLDYFMEVHNIKDEEYYEFSEFLSDNYITDLHSCNVGFLNDELVFTDYSGYGFVEHLSDEAFFDFMNILKE